MRMKKKQIFSFLLVLSLMLVMIPLFTITAKAAGYYYQPISNDGSYWLGSRIEISNDYFRETQGTITSHVETGEYYIKSVEWDSSENSYKLKLVTEGENPQTAYIYVGKEEGKMPHGFKIEDGSGSDQVPYLISPAYATPLSTLTEYTIAPVGMNIYNDSGKTIKVKYDSEWGGTTATREAGEVCAGACDVPRLIAKISDTEVWLPYKAMIFSSRSISPVEVEEGEEDFSFISYNIMGSEEKPSIYKFESADESIATVEVSNERLIIKGIKPGETTITATFKADTSFSFTGRVIVKESSKEAAKVTTPPKAKTDLSENGSAQELITAGEADGGTMQYVLGTDAKTAPTEEYSESIPKETKAGTYYVWYKVKGDKNHKDSEAACVTATISKKEISNTVTFKVVNGSWDDGTNKDQIRTLKGYEGDTLKLKADQIPAVGKKPGNGFAAGTWDTTPDTSTAITKDTTYTYTYAKASEEPSQEPSEGAAKVTKAPTAKKLTYNGKDQKLVAKGTASNGKMYYAVTKNTTAPKTSAYKTSIPTGKAAGTYYVWYKVKGNEGYKDSAVKKVKVTIAKKTEEEPFNFNTSFKVTQKDGQVTVTWNKVNGLSKVDAYVAYCGTNYPAKKFTSTTKNTLTIKKIAGKKIDLTKDFKLTLVGYGPGKKTKKSVSLHIAGKDNKKFTNVKSFTLSKASVSVKKGKSTKVSVKTYKPEDTKKKELSDAHAAKFRYRSTNSKIAKVDKNGRITGVKEGRCKVFVYTRNGLSRKIAVTVTK